MNNVKTILLTGATGFIGSSLAYEFFKHDYSLKLLIRNSKTDSEDRLRKSLHYLFDNENDYVKFKNKVEIINADITREKLGISQDIRKRLRSTVDLVIHCAALTRFEETKKGDMERCNVTGTKNILEFTSELPDPKLFHFSTAYVCGRQDKFFNEDDLDVGQNFNNRYEESKFDAERLLKEYCPKHDIRAAVFRPSIVVGDSKTGKTSNFTGIYGLIKALYFLIELFLNDLKKEGRRASSAGVCYKNGKLHIPIRIAANPEKTLNLVPIDYIVECTLRSIQRDNVFGKTYNLVNPKPQSLHWINKTVCSLVNVSGVQVVNEDAFQEKEMTEWEMFFKNSIKVVIPYLKNNEPRFSDTNTNQLIKGSGIKVPATNKKLIATLLSYFINNSKKNRA